jgi:hypothetical protein
LTGPARCDIVTQRRTLWLAWFAFNLANPPSFGPPAREINAPATFGTITSTVITAPAVEMVLKFFF